MGTLLEVAEDHSTHSAAGGGEEGSVVVVGTLLEVAEDHSTHSAAGGGEEGSAVVATGLAIRHPGNKTLISFLIIDFDH